MTEIGRPDFLELPYRDRQKIVVVSNSVADELRAVAPVDADRPSIWDRLPWRDKPEEGELPEFIRKLAKTRDKLSENGITLRFVSNDQSRGLFFAAPGHPLDNVIYVGHPVVVDKYFPAAVFPRELFDERYCEAFSLLAHLGATRIRIEWHRAHQEEVKGGSRFKLPQFGAGGSVEKVHEDSSTLVFEAALDGGPPMKPDNLVWYDYEETWQTITEMRLGFGLKSFELLIETKEDYGINAQFETSVRGTGLFELGGSRSDTSAESMLLTGEFSAG